MSACVRVYVSVVRVAAASHCARIAHRRLKKKHLSLEEVQAFMDGGAKGLEGVLEPTAKKAKTDADASEEQTTSEQSAAAAAVGDPTPTEGRDDKDMAKLKKKKKKRKPAVADGAMSKKLDKMNTKALSFDDEDGW